MELEINTLLKISNLQTQIDISLAIATQTSVAQC